MRTPYQPGIPAMPDAEDVLAAIRRLELRGARESDDLGPSVEAGVSGRSVSAGGPLVSPPLRDLGLLLDDALIDNLLLVDGPRVSIPVEMALGALADAGDFEDMNDVVDIETIEDVDAHAEDALGARWRLTSWSGRERSPGSEGLSATVALALPAFLKESPLRPRAGAGPSRFPWDLLADVRPGRTRRGPGETGHEPAPCAAPPRSTQGYVDEASLPTARATAARASAGARWSSGAGAILDRPVGVAETETSPGAHERDAERAIARARRAPSPLTVAFASLVFPGWGQALNEERGKAALFRFGYLTTLFLAAALAWRGPLGRLAAALISADPTPAFAWFGTAFSAGAGLWLLSVYDAFVVRTAGRR